MPLVDFNDPALWDGGPTSLYRDGFGRGYVREAKETYIGDDAQRLREALDIKPGQSIILVGAAFGWMAEDWEDAGLGPIVALDTSRWILDRLEHAARPIINEDIGNHAAVTKALGKTRATWCISEDLIAALSDDEAVALAKRMRPMAEHVVHWTSCGIRRGPNPMEGVEGEWAGDPRLNWKTLEDWKELLAPDTVVARNEMGRVL